MRSIHTVFDWRLGSQMISICKRWRSRELPVLLACRDILIARRQTVLRGLFSITFLALGIPNVGLAQPAGMSIDYTLAESGKVSLAVYDSTGHMVRPMIYGQPHVPGKYTVSWDGLDRYGDPMPPGHYEWRLLRTPGFTREFLVNVGINTPWSPFDVWPGNHSGPNVVMVDEDDVLYVGSVSSEGPPCLLKMKLDGRTKLWDTGTWGLGDGLAAMARIGNVVYLQMRTMVDVRRSDNGQKFWGVPKLRRFPEKNLPFADSLHAGDDRAKKVSPMSFAGGKDFLAVTYRNYNEIRFLWPVDDRIQREKTVSLPSPGALTVSSEGRVFVVSGTDIVQVDAESGTIATIVRDVPQPGKIAWDPVFNDLFVVSAAKCVRRYHVPDGKPVAVYGRPNGRTYGVFNPLDFDDILDIAADRRGGFVTAEQYPRRVAHFRGREKHVLVNQWLGGFQWGSQAAIDPNDPTIVYLPIDPKHLGRGKIDYTTKSWTLTHLYDTIDHGSWTIGNISHRDILPFAGERVFWEVRHLAGKTFLVSRGGGTAWGKVTVIRVDEEQNRLLPVAYLGGLHPTLDRRKLPDWWLAALKRIGFNNPKTFEGAGGYRHFAFSWSDKNQNGLVEIDEISLASVGIRAASANFFVAPNWDVVCPYFGTKQAVWSVVPNEGTMESPVWNWDHSRRGNAVYNAVEFANVRPEPSGVYRDRQGAVYLTANGFKVERRDVFDNPPLTWPNSKNHSSRFLKWDAGGREAFSVGLHTDSKFGAAWQFADVRAILGEVKDCLVVMDACCPASVWTRDGLFAGAFIDDVGIPTKLEGWKAKAFHKGAPQDDNQWGQVIETSQGDVLWGENFQNSTPIYRINGWNHWERQQGPLTLKIEASPARRQGRGLMGEYFASADLTGRPVLRRVDPAIWFGTMRGDHREAKANSFRSFAEETRNLPPASPISIRWSGFVEPPLSEDFTFQIYTYGKGKSGTRIRLWIDDKLAIDSWENIALERFKTTGWDFSRELTSSSIPLQTSKQVPIRLECASPGGPDEQLHLYWFSRSLDLRHVPKTQLYPDGAKTKNTENELGRRDQ